MSVIVEALENLWPGKYPEAEGKRWYRRFETEDITQVIAALEWWKDYKKFAPKIGEIERRLIEMENEKQRVNGKTNNTDLRPVDVMRSTNRVPEGIDDWEVIARHWRVQWLRYHVNAEKRRGRINHKPTLDFHDQQDFGFSVKCRVSCTGCLIVEWLRGDWAEAIGTAVVATPDEYEQALCDLHANLRPLRAEAVQRQKAATEEQSIHSIPSLTFRPMPVAPDAQVVKVTALRELAVTA